MSDFDNVAKQTVGDFFDDVQQHGLSATLQNRKMWGEMRMTPTDLSDVNGNTYTYLMNGTTSLGNWTGLFRSGETVRLRFINGSSMTHFDRSEARRLGKGFVSQCESLGSPCPT